MRDDDHAYLSQDLNEEAHRWATDLETDAAIIVEGHAGDNVHSYLHVITPDDPRLEALSLHEIVRQDSEACRVIMGHIVRDAGEQVDFTVMGLWIAGVVSER